MAQIVENDVRLIRQELLAQEEGRLGDAQLIAAYLLVTRKLHLKHLLRKDAPEAYLQYWGVPASVQKMTMLMDFGREPVYRIPATLSVPGVPPVGSMEIPFQVPPELVGSVRLSNGPIEFESRMSERRKSWLARFLGI